MAFDPERLLPENIRRLKAYVPGEQPSDSEWIKLNTNELPYPPSSRVAEAILPEIEKLARYPEPASRALRQAIARIWEVEEASVLIGNGSDDILNLLARCFAGPASKPLQTQPSYSLYPVITYMAGGLLSSVPFEPDFSLPVERILSEQPDVLFLTNPNAPTGILFPEADIARLAEGLSGILVLDEAYAEFCAEKMPLWSRRYPRVVQTRTFSKSWGLAGLRVGYAVADPSVISILDRVRDSYNVNRLSQAGALAAFEDADYYAECREKVITQRKRIEEALRRWGWFFYPSETNFLFLRPESEGTFGPEKAESCFQFLKKERILVRIFPSNALTEAFLRVSVGNSEEVECLLKALEKWHQE